MSYCRFSEGDVYLYCGASGWICCACRLRDKDYEDFLMASPQAALEHLLQHRTTGHVVPERAIERLQEEIRDAENHEAATEEEKCSKTSYHRK